MSNNTNYPFIKFTSPELESLLPDSASLPLHVLHLSEKSFNGIHLHGVRSVGGFVKLLKKGIGKTKGLGAGAHRNIVENVMALSAAIDRAGDLSLVKYTEALGYPVIPPGGVLGVGALMADISTVLRQAVEPQFGPEDWMLFEKRLLVAEGEQKTLDELGKALGLTRERIRQRVESAVQALSRALLQGNYTGLCFRFTEEVSGFFQQAKFYYDSVGQNAWTEDAWTEDLAKTWGIPLSTAQLSIDFLMEVLGFSRRSNKPPIQGALVFCSSVAPKKAEKTVEAVRAVYRILAEECTGLDSIGLVHRLVKKAGISVTLEELPALLSLCPFVENKGEDYFRLPFSLLTDRGDQIVRVLAELGRPAKREEIFRLVNIEASRPLSNLRALSHPLSADVRIEPISRSGHWALKQWGVETKSIEAVMTEILDRAGEPLSMEEIREEVMNRRPCSPTSVSMYLSIRPETFHRTEEGLYGLTAWYGSKALRPRPRRKVNRIKPLQKDVIVSRAVELLRAAPGQSLPMIDLAVALEEDLGIVRPNIYGALSQTAQITKTPFRDKPGKLCTLAA